MYSRYLYHKYRALKAGTWCFLLRYMSELPGHPVRDRDGTMMGGCWWQSEPPVAISECLRAKSAKARIWGLLWRSASTRSRL